MSTHFEERLEQELEQFIRDGVYKRLNYLESPQAARVRMEGRGEVIILSSNNYLGLSNQPEVVAAARRASTATGPARPPCASSAAPTPYIVRSRPPAPAWSEPVLRSAS